jgi:hypothetical protein
MTDDAFDEETLDDDETLDDIEAAVDAISDEHIAARLHLLLAHTVLTQLSAQQPSDESDKHPSIGHDDAGATTVRELVDLLTAARHQLATLHGEALHAQTRRNELLHDVASAQARLAELHRRLADAEAAYLDIALERGQQIIDAAHAAGRRVLADAQTQAQRLLADAEHRKTGLRAEHAHARGRPH